MRSLKSRACAYSNKNFYATKCKQSSGELKKNEEIFSFKWHKIIKSQDRCRQHRVSRLEETSEGRHPIVNKIRRFAISLKLLINSFGNALDLYNRSNKSACYIRTYFAR